MKALYLEWEDSSSIAGDIWNSIETKLPNVKCCSCGFVIKEDEARITLANSHSTSGYMSGDITIPKRAITKRRVVSWKK